MRKFFVLFYNLIRILNYFTIFFFKRDLLINLKEQIEKNSYLKKKICNKNFFFFTPNQIVKWRINTLFDKEPETISWINSFDKKKIYFGT